MTLVEYAEKTSNIPLTDWQKQVLAAYEQAQKENKVLFIILQIIEEFNGLTEYRCSCGRLLGKFNGQAEVKCPKCGKMNVIGGVEKC